MPAARAGLRVAVQTHGCRLNQAESDAMAGLLRDAGHQIVHDADDAADVVVLNTCTITHRADADARRTVRRLTRSGARVVLTGCFVDADEARAAAIPGVAAVLGNATKDAVVAAVEHAKGNEAAPLIRLQTPTRRMPLTVLPAAAGSRARALLKVQDGCNYRCAFCIVPQVRGGSRSLSIDRCVAQASALVEGGATEVVLTGIHLGTWGRDLSPKRRLVDLVAALLPALGPARLRLSSIDPHEVDDDLLALLAEHPTQLCPHLHLPVQSGDDGTLVAMRRGHDARHFVSAVRRAADVLGRPGLGTDVIVGFPGEDEAAFERTRALLASLPLSYLHVFSYSVRPGTAAAEMPDHVPPAEIARRSAVLRQLSADKAAAFRQAHAGATLDVVVNRRAAASRDGWPALSSEYLEVELSRAAAEPLAGQRIGVRVGADGRTATVQSPA